MTSRLTRRRLLAAGPALAMAPAVAGCARGAGGASSELRMMVPNSPGSGYDQTGRAVAMQLEDSGATGRVEVFNVIGAGGAVGLSRLLNERGNGNLIMTMGLGLIGATYAQKSAARVADATPIARLLSEPEGIVVQADSPFRRLPQLLAAWRSDPRALVVSGGSFPGGPDHVFAMELARAVGISPSSVSFRTYDGGGRLLSALLGGRIDFATSGMAEFQAQVDNGQLRFLATSGARREPTLPAIPTLREEGVDLTFTNWRGLLAPPGIGATRRREMVHIVRQMRDSTAWKRAMESRSWSDSWLAGDEFAGYLRSQDRRMWRVMDGLDLP
ncbi:Bug family tripartite tricarboxylate transporter substrate binding protein [Demetria terragena]|uniref:Bug family tripartite tricarboxylate transporter substrate binding protein n=1 Tax=Demetria terragena TaxID=63959 RepID=UPI00035F6099|nr:tripartite tricarboxylate transporter substrate binding protein [Demetria terragena]